MKKLMLLSLLPLALACNKPLQNEVTPSPVLKTTGGNNGPSTSTAYQLVSFSVTKLSPGNLHDYINWTAVGETNITQYELQKSWGNNYSWQIISTIPSSNSNTSISRSITQWASGGTSYFRLKIYHTNNTITYSTIKKVIWKDDIWSNW
jgi:hypothetical protein